jgi:hypothetical protein
LAQHAYRFNDPVDNQRNPPVHPAPRTQPEKASNDSGKKSSALDAGTWNQRPPLVAIGAFTDDGYRDDLFDLDAVYAAETKENFKLFEPRDAAILEQLETAARNDKVYNWLLNIPSVRKLDHNIMKCYSLRIPILGKGGKSNIHVGVYMCDVSRMD